MADRRRGRGHGRGDGYNLRSENRGVGYSRQTRDGWEHVGRKFERSYSRGYDESGTTTREFSRSPSDNWQDKRHGDEDGGVTWRNNRDTNPGFAPLPRSNWREPQPDLLGFDGERRPLPTRRGFDQDTQVGYRTSESYDNKEMFICDDCQMSFSQSWYLEMHVKFKHHNKYLELNYMSRAKVSQEEQKVVDDDNHQERHDVITEVNKNGDSTLSGGTLSETYNKCGVGSDQFHKTHPHTDRAASTGEETYNHGHDLTGDCGKACSSKPITGIHTGEKPYRCDICNCGFTKSYRLKVHKRKHTGEKPYKCDVCNVGFTRSYHLKCHKTKHTGEKPHKCDVCNVGFTRRDILKVHKLQHTGEKPYNCDVCNVGFTEHRQLIVHKIQHTGEKPYKCDVCNNRFTQKSNLYTHLLKHASQKPYKCGVCKAEFAISFHLKSHQNKHTGEKPYKCDVCNFGFTDRGALNRHKIIHTGEKPYKCDVCNVGFAQRGNLNKQKITHRSETLHV